MGEGAAQVAGHRVRVVRRLAWRLVAPENRLARARDRDTPLAMKHRTIQGAIRYTSNKPDRKGQERGRERFTFTHHADGCVTIRALCEIEEPDPTVLRDVVYSLDAAGRPKDCLLRLTVGDAFMGAGFFRFGESFIECESYGPGIGRVSQRVELASPIDGFGTHPIVTDGYFLGRQDWTHVKRRSFSMYVPSPDHRGATAPVLAPVRIDGVYKGRETVSVAAGTFDCWHLQFEDPGGGMGDHPVYDLWVTADEDALFVQGGVGGYMQTWYELVTLDR